MKLVTVFERKELIALQTGVVVEMWDKVMHTGSGKRKLHAEFNEQEIEEIKKLYKLFVHWHCGWSGSGVPNYHSMSIRIYDLARRACNFFASV